MAFALTVTERPCEHADISDRTSVHLSGLTFTCRGGAAPGRRPTCDSDYNEVCRLPLARLLPEKPAATPHGFTGATGCKNRWCYNFSPHSLYAQLLSGTHVCLTLIPPVTTQRLSGPDLQKAGSHGGKPAERRSQIQVEREAGTRSAAPRRALP